MLKKSEDNVHSSTALEKKITFETESKDFFEFWEDNYVECNFKSLLCFFRHKPPPLTTEELNLVIKKLHKYCLLHLHDSYKVHLNRLKGIQLIEEITKRVDAKNLKPVELMSLIWCAVSCMHHFYIRLKIRHGPINWPRRRQMRRSIRVFERLFALIPPQLLGTGVHALITFYTESKMWYTEYLCAELIIRLLNINEENRIIISSILDVAEKTSLVNAHEARQIVRILYQVLERYQWPHMDDDLMLRFLTMFHSSILSDPKDRYDYATLRKGLEVCIRHIMENVPNNYLLKIIKIMVQWTFEDRVSDEGLLDFGNVLEYAAMLHDTCTYRESLQPELLPMILKLISSPNGLHSLLGNRVLQCLMDRHNNKIQFDTPKIFFNDIHFDITVGEYKPEDKLFMRKYREMIHTTFLTAIQLHGVNRINLESIYTSIAIFVVEIPCGYTAAAIVCLAMAIQEYVLSDNDGLELECSNRLHATVMAVMSLVCWVHNAEVFYEYLRTVVTRRAQFSPHLNPPLRANYQYAEHHILWNKPELFFEDWEARYGLWKCFRTRKSRASSLTNAKYSIDTKRL